MPLLGWISTCIFISVIQDGVENGNFDYLYVTDIAMHLLTMSVFLLGSYTRRQELLDIGTANPYFTNFFNAKLFIYMGLIALNTVVGLLMIY